MLGLDPFFLVHAVDPIGQNCIIFADRRTNTTAVAHPVKNPPLGLRVGFFNLLTVRPLCQKLELALILLLRTL